MVNVLDNFAKILETQMNNRMDLIWLTKDVLKEYHHYSHRRNSNHIRFSEIWTNHYSKERTTIGEICSVKGPAASTDNKFNELQKPSGKDGTF